MSLTASNTSPAGDDTMYMPLESLINKLKNNGFSIRPDDYIEILKVIERFQPATLEEAGNLICPLIVSNEEEQARFAVVFRKICEEKEGDIVTAHDRRWKKLKDFIKKNRRYVWLVAGILAVAVILYLVIPASKRTTAIKPVISISDSNGGTFRVGDTLGFDVHQSFTSPEDSNRVDWEWNFGKGWGNKNEKYVSRVAEEKGDHTALLRLMSKEDNSIIADTSLSYTICTAIPEPEGISNLGATIANIKDTIRLNISLPGDDITRYKTAWMINTDTVARNTPALKYAADSVGTFIISFIIYAPDGDAGCDFSSSEVFTAIDPDEKKYQLSAVPTGNVFKTPQKIKPWILGTLFIILIVSAAARFLLHMLEKKRKKKAKSILDSAITTITSAEKKEKKPPYEIPLENRQHQLVASEQAMNDVIRFMHQRTRDEALALNIPQTVQNTIRTGGVPDLVYSNRLRPNDYLIVIDNRVANSQQLKLFEYLVGTFRNESMSVVHFYYKDDFATFYNKQHPAGLSLKRLSELYKEFTLIIYGTAHHLIYDAYPTINADRFNELSDWENKAVLTPIPFKDWSVQEKLIGQQLILLPADAEGQLRLIKAINEKLLRHNDYLSSAENFYSTTPFDFADTADIKEYLNDEDLYQWVCALAIYPGIRWEVLIELGKAVLESRDCPEKMNYSNLLKLVRISWVHEGYFPENTRLELLKQLGLQEELVTRQRLIELFEYADVYFKDNHYFSDEKKMQEITNKFVVYANNPVRHENYGPAKEQFEAMWRNNKITDAPLKKYLDNTGKKKWETPLQQNDKTISAGEYFKTEGSLNPPPPARQKWNNALRSIIGLCVLLLAGLGIWGNNLAGTKAADFLRINEVDSFRTIPVTISHDALGYCLSDYTDSLAFDELHFTLRDKREKIIKQTDSSQGKLIYDIYYAALAHPLSLQANWVVTHLRVPLRRKAIRALRSVTCVLLPVK